MHSITLVGVKKLLKVLSTWWDSALISICPIINGIKKPFSWQSLAWYRKNCRSQDLQISPLIAGQEYILNANKIKSPNQNLFFHYSQPAGLTESLSHQSADKSNRDVEGQERDCIRQLSKQSRNHSLINLQSSQTAVHLVNLLSSSLQATLSCFIREYANCFPRIVCWVFLNTKDGATGRDIKVIRCQWTGTARNSFFGMHFFFFLTVILTRGQIYFFKINKEPR